MQNNRENGFWSSVLAFVKLAAVLVLIYLYIDKWVESYKEKNWRLFIIMSIIPAVMFVEIVKEVYSRSQPNAHNDMFEAQYNAWKSENNL